MENSKKRILIGVFAVVVVLAIVIVLFVCKKNDDSGSLEKRVRELGNVYYEKYYDLIGEDQRISHLSKYTTLGIKVDLENLARTVSDTNGLPSKDEILKEFVKDGKECNMSSKVIFYPQEPYGEKDFKMEVKLDCGEQK